MTEPVVPIVTPIIIPPPSTPHQFAKTSWTRKAMNAISWTRKA